MNSRSVICPHCYNGLDTPESLTGKEVQCPICQKNFVIKFEDVNISGDDIETNPSEDDSFTDGSGDFYIDFGGGDSFDTDENSGDIIY